MPLVRWRIAAKGITVFGFVSEEGKKLPKIIRAEWPLYLAEFDSASNAGLCKGSQYETGAEHGKLTR